MKRREAELESTRHDIAGLKATAPLARQQADDYKKLVPEKYVSKQDYLEKEQNALRQEHDLAAKKSHADELAAAIVGQKAEIASLTSQFRREQLTDLDKATNELAQTRDDETKAVTREHLMRIDCAGYGHRSADGSTYAGRGGDDGTVIDGDRSRRCSGSRGQR